MLHSYRARRVAFLQSGNTFFERTQHPSWRADNPEVKATGGKPPGQRFDRRLFLTGGLAAAGTAGVLYHLSRESSVPTPPAASVTPAKPITGDELRSQLGNALRGHQLYRPDIEAFNLPPGFTPKPSLHRGMEKLSRFLTPLVEGGEGTLAFIDPRESRLFSIIDASHFEVNPRAVQFIARNADQALIHEGGHLSKEQLDKLAEMKRHFDEVLFPKLRPLVLPERVAEEEARVGAALNPSEIVSLHCWNVDGLRGNTRAIQGLRDDVATYVRGMLSLERQGRYLGLSLLGRRAQATLGQPNIRAYIEDLIGDAARAHVMLPATYMRQVALNEVKDPFARLFVQDYLLADSYEPGRFGPVFNDMITMIVGLNGPRFHDLILGLARAEIDPGIREEALLGDGKSDFSRWANRRFFDAEP
jgi:hypothetical protein